MRKIFVLTRGARDVSRRTRAGAQGRFRTGHSRPATEGVCVRVDREGRSAGSLGWSSRTPAGNIWRNSMQIERTPGFLTAVLSDVSAANVDLSVRFKSGLGAC